MPNVTIYLPEDLHRKVKKADIAVSAVCQEALREVIGEVLPGGRELTDGEAIGAELDDMAKRLRRIANKIEEKL